MTRGRGVLARLSRRHLHSYSPLGHYRVRFFFLQPQFRRQFHPHFYPCLSLLPYSYPFSSFPPTSARPHSHLTMMRAVEGKPDGSLIIRLHVKPGAKQSRVTDVGETSVGLAVTAPPREGEANEEVLQVMADLLGIKTRFLSLVAGHKSRDKVIFVSSEAGQQELRVLERLLKKGQE